MLPDEGCIGAVGHAVPRGVHQLPQRLPGRGRRVVGVLHRPGVPLVAAVGGGAVAFQEGAVAIAAALVEHAAHQPVLGLLAVHQLAVDGIGKAEEAFVFALYPHLHKAAHGAVAPVVVGAVRQTGEAGENVHRHAVAHVRTIGSHGVEDVFVQPRADAQQVDVQVVAGGVDKVHLHRILVVKHRGGAAVVHAATVALLQLPGGGGVIVCYRECRRHGRLLAKGVAEGREVDARQRLRRRHLHPGQ